MHRHIVNLVLLFLLGAGAVLVWRATQPEPTATAPLVTDQRDRIQRAGFERVSTAIQRQGHEAATLPRVQCKDG